MRDLKCIIVHCAIVHSWCLIPNVKCQIYVFDKNFLELWFGLFSVVFHILSYPYQRTVLNSPGQLSSLLLILHFKQIQVCSTGVVHCSIRSSNTPVQSNLWLFLWLFLYALAPSQLLYVSIFLFNSCSMQLSIFGCLFNQSDIRFSVLGREFRKLAAKKKTMQYKQKFLVDIWIQSQGNYKII